MRKQMTGPWDSGSGLIWSAGLDLSVGVSLPGPHNYLCSDDISDFKTTMRQGYTGTMIH